MSLEHSTTAPEDRYARLLQALYNHTAARAAFDFHADYGNTAEATHYHRQIVMTMDELRTLGVFNAKGEMEATLQKEEGPLMEAFYADEIARWQAATFQENAQEAEA